MEQDILDIIEKDLPNQVGQQLKLKIEQADKDATAVKEQSELIKYYLKSISDLNIEINAANSLLNEHRNVDLKIQDLEVKERALEISELKIKLETEKDKSKFAQDVAMGLVRNTNYRKHIFDSSHEQIPVADQYGGTIMETATNNKTYTENIETD